MGNTWWSSGNEAAGKVKNKTLEDEVDAGKQSDQPEEELTSTKQTAMENVHHGETNMEKVSPPHDSTTLETSTAPPQSVSPSCKYIEHGCTSIECTKLNYY